MTYSILVIGGEAASRSELASVLNEAGFAIATAPDYPKTLFRQNGAKPDLVIMDEMLPNRDAMEACYELETVFGIPVILLGEDSSKQVWGRVMEAGADLYLVKPVRYRELVARIKAILRRYERWRSDWSGQKSPSA
jgi:DNA-binding response OmpR family regulator